MPAPRLPVAPATASPPVVAARHRQRRRRVRWVVPKKAADLSGLSLKTIYRHCHDGEIVAKKLGGIWRIRIGPDDFPVLRSELTP